MANSGRFARVFRAFLAKLARLFTRNRIGLAFFKNMSPSLPELQRRHVDRAFGMFLHFNMGTFTNEEWAKPSRPDISSLFNPVSLDTDQWADLAFAAGMKYAILTAKHHDGFALWESDVEELGGYSVKATEWYKREVAAGRSGDIVKRFVDSFRSRGLAPGLYLSIWDRTAGLSRKSTKDKKWATQFVKAQITQLLTRYGEIPVLWTDGWKWFDGEQPDGPVGYDLVDFREIYAHIKQISPNTLLMENNHEKNLVHTDIVGFERNVIQLPPSDNRLPSEVCDTLRADDKWFFHPEGNEDVKSVEFIVDSLRACKERNAAYLLDVTPDREGRIPEAQAARLRKVGQVLKKPEGRL